MDGDITLPEWYGVELTKSGRYQLFINSGTLTVPNSVTLTLTDWAEVREGGTLTVEKGGQAGPDGGRGRIRSTRRRPYLPGRRPQ